MKRFNCFFLVFALVFFAACSDGVERIVPELEKEGESEEVERIDSETENDEDSTSDEDVSDSSVDPSEPDTDSDTTDTSDEGDAADSGDDTDSGDDSDSGDNSDSGDDTDSGDDADSGTPDNGDTTEDKYCSAVFNGESSKIEIQHSELLNLGSSWTIEAWFMQDLDNLSQDTTTIIRKGGEQSVSYYLTALRQNETSYGPSIQTYKTIEGGFYYNNFSSFVATNGNFDDVLKDGWNHIAMSYFVTNNFSGQKASLLIYINGIRISEKTEKVRSVPVPNQLTDSLVIGYDAYQKTYFNGKIDQLKISTNTYEGEFTPSRLSVDDNTIAFWDFNNDTNDASPNALNGIGANITYSTDCME